MFSAIFLRHYYFRIADTPLGFRHISSLFSARLPQLSAFATPLLHFRHAMPFSPPFSPPIAPLSAMPLFRASPITNC